MTEPDRLRDRRVQYETAGLDVGDVDADPVTQWHRWYDDSVAAGVVEPNAMSLATADDDGADVRIVLVRGVDASGIAFFTNYASTKGRQLDAVSRGAAAFGWLDLHRQVRVRGRVHRIADDESDAYFATRPRSSQIGAWASPQSEVITDRAVLDRRVADAERRFGGGPVPRPPFWGGFRLEPDVWEFWQGRPNRLHDRLRYRPASENGWFIERLAP